MTYKCNCPIPTCGCKPKVPNFMKPCDTRDFVFNVNLLVLGFIENQLTTIQAMKLDDTSLKGNHNISMARVHIAKLNLTSMFECVHCVVCFSTVT